MKKTAKAQSAKRREQSAEREEHNAGDLFYSSIFSLPNRRIATFFHHSIIPSFHTSILPLSSSQNH
jgi:hypothetical protein